MKLPPGHGIHLLGESPVHPVLWLDLDGVIRSSTLNRPGSPGVAMAGCVCWIASPPSLLWLPITLGVLNESLPGLASSPTFLPLTCGVPTSQMDHVPSRPRAFALASPFSWFSVVTRH